MNTANASSDRDPGSAARADVDSAEIRQHYDGLSRLYHRFWGEHIHHGYWAENKTTGQAEAQIELVKRLAQFAGIREGSRVLDVGCGLGGSSLWLAQQRRCSMLGITLSPLQVELATERARDVNLAAQVQFQVHDANDLNLPAESFDAVWVIECSEHLQDKQRFIANCHRVLRPGGVLALCAWLAGEDDTAENAQLLSEICESMLCPSLGRMDDYVQWMQTNGFRDVAAEDISERVRETWDRCVAIAQRAEVRALLHAMDSRTRRFVRSFGVMQQAYRTRALAYGMFAAWKADLASG